MRKRTDRADRKRTPQFSKVLVIFIVTSYIRL